MVRRHSASEKCSWQVGLRKCIRPLLERFLRAIEFSTIERLSADLIAAGLESALPLP
jgi:hypothetical protein